MTVYVLTRQKLIPSAITFHRLYVKEWFCGVNRGGIISAILIAVIVLSLLSYIFALFLTFHMGFVIREKDFELDRSKEEVISLELEIRKFSAEFVEIYRDVLSDMEKISKIEYILPQSIVNSHLMITP